jgi:Mitochondrial large subunit ribosomal protein (Img2)
LIDRLDKSGSKDAWPNGIPSFEGVDKTLSIKIDRMPVKYEYYIQRTKSKNLPVYQISKRGGTFQVTEIRHVEGDPRVYRSSFYFPFFLVLSFLWIGGDLFLVMDLVIC